MVSSTPSVENNPIPEEVLHHHVDAAGLQADAKLALNGDSHAAERVVVALGTVPSHELGDRAEWIRIGAENGSPGLMALYAQLLHEKGGSKECERALFWLRRATEVNPPMARHNEILRQEIEKDQRCVK